MIASTGMTKAMQTNSRQIRAKYPEFVTFAPFLSKFGHPLAE